jgi:hypothetical protein
VVERSLDGEAWTEIDQETNSNDFTDHWRKAPFAVSNSVECCFVRLTHTGKKHNENDILPIKAFEVFGTFLEW